MSGGFRFAILIFSCLSIPLAAPASANAAPFAEVGALVFAENKDREQSFEARVPMAIRGGYQWKVIDAYLEYSGFSEKEGEGNVSVERRQHYWTGWSRYKFALVDGNIHPYMGAGVGFQYTVVRTTLGSRGLTNTGEPYPLIALATGAMMVFKNHISVGIDLRVAASESYDPNPMLAAGGFLGYSF